jgi:hypothetical protein
MRRKKKARRGWRKKKRKPALASSIPGFVAALVLVPVQASTSVLHRS